MVRVDVEAQLGCDAHREEFCENLLETLLSIDEKDKGTEKARWNLEDLRIKSTLQLEKRGNRWFKPQVFYVLTPTQMKEFAELLKSVNFFDGLAGRPMTST